MSGHAVHAERFARPRGVALLLVIAVVALAAVLGFAMLSSATLQNRTGANAQRSASVDYLIESGINLAMYYLQYPEKAPTLNSSGYWDGTGGDMAIGSGVSGTINVNVTRDSIDTWSYEIQSTGTITGGSTRISKKGGCRVYVRNQFVAKSSAAFNFSAQVCSGTKFDGDVYCSKTLSMKSTAPAAIVTGVGYCKASTTGIGYTTPTGGYSATLSGSSVAPNGTEIFLYYPKYSYNDTQYDAGVIITGALLPANTLTNLIGIVTRGITVSNPMGVYYCDSTSGGALKLGDNCNIQGTLIVKGDCQIAGKNISITANSGFPALVVTGNLEVINPSNNAMINGVVFIGGQLKSSGSAPLSTLTITGALLSGNDISAPISTSYNATTVIKYDASKCVAADLSWKLRSPKGVSIVRWGLPPS